MDLSSNHIGDQGATALGVALQHNSTLAALTLFDNNIGEEGAKALGVALQYNTALQHLNLFLTNMGSIGKTAFEVALLRNTTIRRLILPEDSSSISCCIAKNKELYSYQYWSTHLHVGFNMTPCHQIIMTTLLCNRSTSNYPALPDHVWYLIFSFLQRKKLLELGSNPNIMRSTWVE